MPSDLRFVSVKLLRLDGRGVFSTSDSGHLLQFAGYHGSQMMECRVVEFGGEATTRLAKVPWERTAEVSKDLITFCTRELDLRMGPSTVDFWESVDLSISVYIAAQPGHYRNWPHDYCNYVRLRGNFPAELYGTDAPLLMRLLEWLRSVRGGQVP